MATTPATTRTVPTALAMVILSTWRRKIAVIIRVQIGVVEAMGETTTTGPSENARSIRRTGSFSNGGDSTVWRAGGFFVGILGRCLGYLICAGSTSLSSERRLLGCGISFWRHSAFPGCSYGGFTA